MTFICPNCKAKLSEVGLVVNATQFFDFDTCQYSNIEEIEATESYFCPECGDNLDFKTVEAFINKVLDEVEGGDF